MNDRLEKIVTDFCPPRLAWHLLRRARERREMIRFLELYRNFLKPGDRCFDIGANLGKFGRPAFMKIDVEGFEAEVIAGLSAPVDSLSFEWTPELTENAVACIGHLVSLGEYEFNLSIGESMRLAGRSWKTPESMIEIVRGFDGESLIFGDIYARLKGSANR